jgi:tetratricopeptide (TPR) repeat protein
VAILALAVAAPLAAQPSPTVVELDKSATRELYVSRRPPVPVSPRIPPELEALIAAKEKAADAKRAEAIALLREFLAARPRGDSRAEGLFKLAELLWEDSRRRYVAAMDRWERKIEACRRTPAACKRPPPEPDLDFSESERHYKTILADHPDYPRIDLVLYLVGFAAREDNRADEALRHFGQVIEKYPKSPLYHDSWMMIAEFHFQGGRWAEARSAYAEVLADTGAQGYDLALFKSAWCDWKLGQANLAARKFKQVLDLAEEARRSGSSRERKRREQLRDEALDYLVLVFTEDESVTAKDVYDFLASIGGERYSAAVLKRLAETYYTQGRWERSVEAYRFLIGLGPERVAAARYQREIVNAYLEALESEKAMDEIRVLVETYGAGSPWAKANAANQTAVDRVVASTEALVRNLAKRFHADAQSLEKDRGAPDVGAYRRAASSYAYYLSAFADNANAIEVRFLRAEILYFKLGKLEESGDEFLAVGKTAPVGDYHKKALRIAMAAFKSLRPKNIGKRRELSPVDRKFAEATDLYATLFEGDDEIVGVIFENGQLFYDYGDYDEAIKRFGLIVTKYPDDENAGAAGDRLLDALNKAEDYENIEEWARKLKKAKAFQSDTERKRLDRLIVESIGKSGEKYAAGGKYEKAAGFYLRIPEEFPDHPLAAGALFDAAVMWEKAKKPEKAAGTYLAVAERFGKSPRAGKAAFTAARVYESIAYFDRAAAAYELVAERYPRSDDGADALFNAGVLRQALGEPKAAIGHFQSYARRFRRTKNDAEEVAFRVGVVYEEAGQAGRAERAFDSYLKTYRRGTFALEALMRSGRAALSLGKTGRARRKLQEALSRHRRLGGDEARASAGFAAEARYHLGEIVYKEYAAISLDVPARRLERTLSRKNTLLDKAAEIYLQVLELQDPPWATAALYRIGSVTEEFATTLRETPTPKGLSEADQTLYRDELDKYVIDIEEKAIERYESGYRTALELRVYNQFTRKLREALSRMSPSSFPPENEIRAGHRIGDRVPEPAIVEEVVRDGA